MHAFFPNISEAASGRSEAQPLSSNAKRDGCLQTQPNPYQLTCGPVNVQLVFSDQADSFSQVFSGMLLHLNEHRQHLF